MEIQRTQTGSAPLTFSSIVNGSISAVAPLAVDASPWRTPERSLANENLHQFWSELSLEQPVLPFFGRFLQSSGNIGAGGTHAVGEGDNQPAAVAPGDTGDASVSLPPRSFSHAKHETDRDEPAVVAQPVLEGPRGVGPRSFSHAKHETDRDEPAVVAQPVLEGPRGVGPRSFSHAKHETDRDEAPVTGQVGNAGNQSAFFNRFLKA